MQDEEGHQVFYDDYGDRFVVDEKTRRAPTARFPWNDRVILCACAVCNLKAEDRAQGQSRSYTITSAVCVASVS